MTVDKQDVIERAAAAYSQAVLDIQLGDGEKPAMAAAIRVVLEDQMKAITLPAARMAIDLYAASIGIKPAPDQPGTEPLKEQT